MPASEFAAALSSLLAEFGGALTEPQVRRLTKMCRDEIFADELARGGSIERPFFNFVGSDSVAVFTFFEAEFSVYVFRGDERQLIADTNDLALADTAECKSVLAAKYNKPQPDFVVSRALCEHWLERD